MRSLILSSVTYLMMPVLLMVSVLLLIRGHDAPGGGFVAGLMAASALALYRLTYGTKKTRQVIYFDPKTLAGIGLLISTLSGILPLFNNQEYMEAQWVHCTIGPWSMDIGTPMVFDLGVYFVVIGMVIGVVICLSEE